MAEKDITDRAPGRFAYEGLDRLLHERARLAVLSSLAANPDGVAFNDLKDLCALTDGNLSRQLQILKDAGLLEVEKTAKNNRPLTLCRLTPRGRKRFIDYIEELERVVADASAAQNTLENTVARASTRLSSSQASP